MFQSLACFIEKCNIFFLCSVIFDQNRGKSDVNIEGRTSAERAEPVCALTSRIRRRSRGVCCESPTRYKHWWPRTALNSLPSSQLWLHSNIHQEKPSPFTIHFWVCCTDSICSLVSLWVRESSFEMFFFRVVSRTTFDKPPIKYPRPWLCSLKFMLKLYQVKASLEHNTHPMDLDLL